MMVSWYRHLVCIPSHRFQIFWEKRSEIDLQRQEKMSYHDDDFEELEMEGDVMKERGTTDRSGKYMKFDQYYDSVGRTYDALAVPSTAHDLQYIQAHDLDVLEIPAGCQIIAAYWGDARNIAKGKPVTKELVRLCGGSRIASTKQIPASTEYFGVRFSPSLVLHIHTHIQKKTTGSMVWL
jgi:hypothetical protein